MILLLTAASIKLCIYTCLAGLKKYGKKCPAANAGNAAIMTSKVFFVNGCMSNFFQTKKNFRILKTTSVVLVLNAAP